MGFEACCERGEAQAYLFQGRSDLPLIAHSLRCDGEPETRARRQWLLLNSHVQQVRYAYSSEWQPAMRRSRDPSHCYRNVAVPGKHVVKPQPATVRCRSSAQPKASRSASRELAPLLSWAAFSSALLMIAAKYVVSDRCQRAPDFLRHQWHCRPATRTIRARMMATIGAASSLADAAVGKMQVE